jgi:hypothetical protein
MPKLGIKKILVLKLALFIIVLAMSSRANFDDSDDYQHLDDSAVTLGQQEAA